MRPILRPLPVLALLALTSCSAVPEQGFATRYQGGSFGGVLRDTFEPMTDFSGAPLERARSVRPARAGGRLTCEETAQDRSDDVAAEGFDEALQKTVYDRTLADCRAWAGRY